MRIWCLTSVCLSRKRTSGLSRQQTGLRRPKLAQKPSDLYFTALTINLLTYFTKEATQTIHHFVQNCSRCIENYHFKHKNLVGCRKLRPLTPHGGLCLWTPARGSAPDPHYRLALPRSPWVCFWPQFSLPSGALYGALPSSFVQSFPMPSSELRRITHENVEL